MAKETAALVNVREAMLDRLLLLVILVSLSLLLLCVAYNRGDDRRVDDCNVEDGLVEKAAPPITSVDSSIINDPFIILKTDVSNRREDSSKARVYEV